MISQSQKIKTALSLVNKKVRKCRSLHYCCLCDKTIKNGQLYYDSGYGKRGHDLCVKAYSNVICKHKIEDCNCIHAVGHTPVSGIAKKHCYEKEILCSRAAHNVICVPLTIIPKGREKP